MWFMSRLCKRLDRIEHTLEASLAVQRETLALLQRQFSTAAVVELWLINPDGTRSKLDMAFTMTDVQSAPLSVTITDARGNPAKVDGVPTWVSSDPTVLTATAAADGMSCVIAAVGPLGTAQVKFTADADLSPGVSELVGILDVEIIASAAVNVVITPGTPS
jgi:hypothetical protein